MPQLRPISVVVHNERGVLARVAALFARRGFNIVSLAVGETHQPQLSRISVVVQADEPQARQVVKQLERLVCVRQVAELSDQQRVERGLALIKVRADSRTRGEIAELARIFRARVDHVGSDQVIVEVSGRRDKVQALIDLLRPYGILEMARTGPVVLSREQTLTAEQEESEETQAPSQQGRGADQEVYHLTQTA